MSEAVHSRATSQYGVRLPLPMDRGTQDAKIRSLSPHRKELQIVGSLPHVVGYLHDLKSIVDDAVAKANEAAAKATHAG